jgi:ATP citrate (pro-S)-lyase
MIDTNNLPKSGKMLVVGDHKYLNQSVLDFDYLSGKEEPSIKAILSSSNGYTKYFWGKKEILIPTYRNISDVNDIEEINWFLCLASGRRVLSYGKQLIDNLPNLIAGSFFAEGVPEAHSIELYRYAQQKEVNLVGPATVGFLVPSIVKLGAIGGISPKQIDDAKLIEQGKIAVMSASGGMSNELINLVVKSGHRLSFALSFGGDRFPIVPPKQAFLMAENDKNTEAIVYYGELGGDDEYKLIELKKEGKITKPAIIHVAGTVADLFPESPQFGHAKAKASKEEEKALVKREKLKEAGFMVSDSFADVSKLLKDIK